MASKDIISKQLLKRLALDMARYLFGLEIIEADWVETEFQRVEDRRADVVIRARAPEEYLLHIEIQNDNHSRMSERMLRYWLDIHEAYPKERIIQYVIYIGGNPLNMRDNLTTDEWAYRYHLLDMHCLDCEAFLREDNPDALIMAILCDFKGRPEREVIRYILSRLHVRLGDKSQQLRDYLGMLEILSTNRNLQTLVNEERAMLSMIDVNELPSYQSGLQKGREEGLQMGSSKILLFQLEHKFGSLTLAQRERVLQASSAEIEKWSLRLLTTAQNLEDVFQDN